MAKKREKIFTPFSNGVKGYEIDDMGRVHMVLSEHDYEKLERGHPWRATITDQNTDRRFKVRGADCGAGGCFCAAEIVAEITTKAIG